MYLEKYTIGMGLSGGGTRGVAHIGALKALEEADIRPQILCGTSAGAIVGSLYAAGCKLDEIYEFVASSSLWKAYRMTWPNTGLTDFTYLRDRLAQMIPQDAFEALQIPLYVGITNLLSGQLEIKNSGQLFEVVQAASSIPTVFKPVEIGDQLYVDGGVINNFPVQSIRDHCHFLIGVNVMPQVPVERHKVRGILGIAIRSVCLNIAINSRPGLDLCDVLIQPEELDDYHVFDFKNLETMYQLGYDSTRRILPEIKAKLAQHGDG